MDFSPLTTAPQPIPVHAYLAMAAFFIGLLQFALPKGGTVHKVLGYVWMTAMAVVAISSFFINEIRLIGPFSPIHLLSILTLWGIYSSIASARRGDIRRHKQNNIQLFCFALIIAGAFTFLPGRLMHTVVFGG